MTTDIISDDAATAAIDAACRSLRLPTVRTEAGPAADAAVRDRLTHRAYLAELLASETEARTIRRRQRRIKEARFPRHKTLADFDPTATPDIPAALLTTLASGAWIDRAEPLVLLGDSGTGKSHLLIALGIAACHQGRSVRYVTAAGLATSSSIR